jgi:hypothetical protein
MHKLLIAGGVALAIILIGCSEMQQPPMTQDQVDTYNQCMSTHWSVLADSAIFGFSGYEYHQNQVLNCQQVALLPKSPSASSDKPVKPVAAAVPASVPAN